MYSMVFKMVCLNFTECIVKTNFNHKKKYLKNAFRQKTKTRRHKDK